jgi:GT2 family glycosyltransferase
VQDRTNPAVTAGILNFNRKQLLDECIAALAAQEIRPARVILVDNGSSDGSVEHVRERHPWVEVVPMGSNRGLGAPRNHVLKAADTELVLLIDEDIVLAPDCLRHLVAAMEAPGVAVAAPLVVYYNRPNVVQYGGFGVHYLCVGIVRAGPIQEFTASTVPYTVTAVAGGAMLVRRAAALHVGLFDEDLFFGREDGEFCARLTEAGYRCVEAPAAVVRHNMGPRGKAMMYYQVRNRWLYMLRLYSARTLLLIAPMLLLYEVALMGLLLAKLELHTYVKADLAVLRALPRILRKRRQTQALRRIPDSQWLTTGDFAPTRVLVLTGPLARARRWVNGFVNGYWTLVRPLV